MGFIINCDQATTICDKSQYGEASLYDKIKLNYHLLMCKFCLSYTKQNNIMTQIFGKHLKPCEGMEHLSDKEKEELHSNLKKEIEKS